MRKNILWTKAHAEACQVSITEGEKNYEEDEPAVMMEEDGQVETRLNVTQHEKRNEDETTHDGHRKYQTVLLWPHTDSS